MPLRAPSPPLPTLPCSPPRRGPSPAYAHRHETAGRAPARRRSPQAHHDDSAAVGPPRPATERNLCSGHGSPKHRMPPPSLLRRNPTTRHTRIHSSGIPWKSWQQPAAPPLAGPLHTLQPGRRHSASGRAARRGRPFPDPDATPRIDTSPERLRPRGHVLLPNGTGRSEARGGELTDATETRGWRPVLRLADLERWPVCQPLTVLRSAAWRDSTTRPA